MKFTSLQDTPNICKGWQNHGAVNEDRTVVFTSIPVDRCNFLKGDSPLDKLKELLTRFTLCPRFENSGGHFGRMLPSNWSSEDALSGLIGEGQLLEKVVNGWCFSGNFHDLSCGFSVYVADRELAREIFELIIANYKSDKYKEAVKGAYRTTSDYRYERDEHIKKNVVYYNPLRKAFYVARPEEAAALPITEERADNMRRGHWLKHAYLGSVLIGRRNKVDYATLLESKLEDILK